MLKLSLVPVTVLAILALNGCGSETTPTGPEQHDSQHIEMDKSERVRVELKMPVGELDVRGGATKLMDGEFTYNVAAWKPELRYQSTGGVGDLALEQHGPSSSRGNSKNHWDLRLNDTVAMDLRVKVGAGEARLNLGSLSLRSVEMEMGAGQINLDLRGTPTKDYSVRIRGGVGEAVVHLPKAAGLSATAKGGLGDISVTGLRKDGDHYVNDAYETAAVKIRLDIQGGVGSNKLIAE